MDSDLGTSTVVAGETPKSSEITKQSSDSTIFNDGSFPNMAWIVEAMLVGRPGGYGPRDMRNEIIVMP